MKIAILFLFVIFSISGYSQKGTTCEKYVGILENEIVFNEYLTDEVRVEKIKRLINKVEKMDFDKKDLFLKYAQVNLAFTRNDNDQALYKFVELTEICDLKNQTELRIYLGSLLQISSILRENNAIELSYRYIKRGIEILEKGVFKTYPWMQDFYNDAGVDLLSMADYKKSRVALEKALTFGGKKDYLQDAMIEYNLSFLFFEQQDIDSAIFHQQNTCSYLEKITNLDSYPDLYGRYGNSLGSLAIFYFSSGEIDQAKSTALKAKSVFDKIKVFDSGRYPHLFTLINVAIEENDKKDIEPLLKEIEFTAQKVEAGRYNFYELLSDSYNRLGNSTQENNNLSLAYHQFQTESGETVENLQEYNSKLQSQILQREKIRFQNEKLAFKRKAFLNTSIISLILVVLITILYLLYVKVRNKKNLLEKEKEISKIEIEKNEIKSRLTESELNEKRLVTNRLASHIKLKQQTETAFLQKIKELKRNKAQNIEAEISELQVKMINLISIDQNFDHHEQVNDLNQEFRLKLKENHPDLSEKELQFCSYLLLDLTAKEIGSITNQSDGAIRVYKNRLKTKLVGKEDIDLLQYLQNL